MIGNTRDKSREDLVANHLAAPPFRRGVLVDLMLLDQSPVGLAGKVRPDLKSTRELAEYLREIAGKGSSWDLRDGPSRRPSLARLESVLVHEDPRQVGTILPIMR
jgi:hypothetical protein